MKKKARRMISPIRPADFCVLVFHGTAHGHDVFLSIRSIPRGFTLTLRYKEEDRTHGGAVTLCDNLVKMLVGWFALG